MNQPPTFEGTAWEFLSKRLNNYICLQEEDYETLRPRATIQTAPLCDAEVTQTVTLQQQANGLDAQTATSAYEKLKTMSRLLQNLLANYTKGSPYTAVNQINPRS